MRCVKWDTELANESHILVRGEQPVLPTREEYLEKFHAQHDKPTWERWDDELENPAWHNDEQVLKQEEEELVKRMYVKSPQQNEEAYCKAYEKNVAMSKEKGLMWEGQDCWKGRENEEMRMVNVLHCDKFIDRLSRIGIRSDRGFNLNPNVRFCLNDFVKVGRIGINAWVPDDRRDDGTDNRKNGYKRLVTVTTLQYPYSIEYTIMRFDRYGVPTNERYRGWRTALLMMVYRGVLTEDEAERAFGPALGLASARYRKELFLIRNHHGLSKYGISLHQGNAGDPATEHADVAGDLA